MGEAHFHQQEVDGDRTMDHRKWKGEPAREQNRTLTWQHLLLSEETLSDLSSCFQDCDSITIASLPLVTLSVYCCNSVHVLLLYIG